MDLLRLSLFTHVTRLVCVVFIPGLLMTTSGCGTARALFKTGIAGCIVYERNGDIRIWDFSERRSTTIVPGPDNSCPRFSPNGEWIAFQYTSPSFAVSNNVAIRPHKLYVVRPNGTDRQMLCSDSRAFFFVYFWRNEHQIICVKNNGESFRAITISPDIEATPWRSVEPQSGYAREKDVPIALARLVSQRKTPFVFCPSDRRYYTQNLPPSLLFSPDYRAVVLSHPFYYHINSIDHRKVVLKIRDVETQSDLLGLVSDEIAPMLLYEQRDGSYPSWSPDSSGIVFDAIRRTSPDNCHLVWIADIDDSNGLKIEPLVRLRSKKRSLKGNFLERYSMPCWSPDGRYVACCHTKPTILDKIQPIQLSYHCKKMIYVHDLKTNQGADLFEGNAPNWHH